MLCAADLALSIKLAIRVRKSEKEISSLFIAQMVSRSSVMVLRVKVLIPESLSFNRSSSIENPYLRLSNEEMINVSCAPILSCRSREIARRCSCNLFWVSMRCSASFNSFSLTICLFFIFWRL